MFLGGNHAERSVSVREGNEPRPDIRFRRVYTDADLLPVEFARDDVVFYMHKQRRTLGKIRRAIEIEQAWQGSAKAAGIQHELGPERTDFIAGPGRDHGTLAGNVDRGDLHFMADRRAEPRRLVGEHLVELCALHLKRERIAARELFGEI